MELHLRVSKNLTELLKQSHKTQAQIAREVGIDPSAITEFKQGISLPRLITFVKLCQALDCTYDEILGKQE